MKFVSPLSGEQSAKRGGGDSGGGRVGCEVQTIGDTDLIVATI